MTPTFLKKTLLTEPAQLAGKTVAAAGMVGGDDNLAVVFTDGTAILVQADAVDDKDPYVELVSGVWLEPHFANDEAAAELGLVDPTAYAAWRQAEDARAAAAAEQFDRKRLAELLVKYGVPPEYAP